MKCYLCNVQNLTDIHSSPVTALPSALPTACLTQARESWIMK